MRAVPVTCAIYTRKSSEEGLEQDFNSLDAQREACAAYILSQKALGWVSRREVYDDGGFSGGSTERPALQRLLADIGAGLVKVVVVYKVDRLTRSLADFAKMVELFDAQGVSFVSVTQQFNTTSSMGRLTLNVLLSFAQFEREVTGERIRDKIAASKRKGMWMGGMCPVGYTPFERTLLIDEAQASRIREIFQLYLELDCVRKLGLELNRREWLTPVRATRRPGGGGNRPFSRGHLYRILRNPIYIGQIAHKDQVHPGNHPAIIDLDTWSAVQARLESNRQGHKTRQIATTQNILNALVFDAAGNRFIATHSQKGNKRYRYYVQQGVEGQALRIPAPDLEQTVASALEEYLQDEHRILAHSRNGVPDDVATVTGFIKDARNLSERIQLGSAEAMQEVLEKVVVQADRLVLHIKSSEDQPQELQQPPSAIEVPIALKRSGQALRLIVQSSSAQKAKPDPKLIRLVARSFDWAMRLTSGKASTVQEIATAEGVTSTYVSRLMQVGLLAPDLMLAITRGEQPTDLTAMGLLALGSLPLDWREQRRQLKFKQR